MESGRGALERYENEEQEISPLTDQKVQNPNNKTKGSGAMCRCLSVTDSTMEIKLSWETHLNCT